MWYRARATWRNRPPGSSQIAGLAVIACSASCALLATPASADARRCGDLPLGGWPTVTRVKAHDVGGCEKARKVARDLKHTLASDPERDFDATYVLHTHQRFWACRIRRDQTAEDHRWIARCRQQQHSRRYVSMRLTS